MSWLEHNPYQMAPLGAVFGELTQELTGLLATTRY